MKKGKLRRKKMWRREEKGKDEGNDGESRSQLAHVRVSSGAAAVCGESRTSTRSCNAKPLLRARRFPLTRATQTPAERCRSGRTGRSRKPLRVQALPGFESLSLRHFMSSDLAASGNSVNRNACCRHATFDNAMTVGMAANPRYPHHLVGITFARCCAQTRQPISVVPRSWVALFARWDMSAPMHVL